MGYFDGNLNLFAYGAMSSSMPYIPPASTPTTVPLFGGGFAGNSLPMPMPIPQTQSSYFSLSNVAAHASSLANKIVSNIKTSVSNFGSGFVSTVKKGFQNVTGAISNFAQNMVSKAKSYLGYNERNGSYKLFTQGRTEAWCADFVSYVARQCGKVGFNFPSVQGILDWGKRNNRFSRTAKVGDAIIFKGAGASHTGIVTKVENGRVYTIEGNTSDKVAERSYSLSDRRITGFVTIA